MSSVNAKPTFLDIGDLHIKRRNFQGWYRENPGKIKLYLAFEDYGMHSEWINGSEEEIDEIENKLLELRDNNML